MLYVEALNELCRNIASTNWKWHSELSRPLRQSFIGVIISNANGPVLFWIGLVFQYSNLEPVRSFNWSNLDRFWSFGANRFTSKTRSRGSIEP